MRCDVNISVRKPGEPLGTRVEVKNVNSFRGILKAIDYEVERQTKLLNTGRSVPRETRYFNPEKEITIHMRRKEEQVDYRFMPEPDLPLLHITTVYLFTRISIIFDAEIDKERIEAIAKSMVEHPDSIQDRFLKQYKLSHGEIQFLLDKNIPFFFDQVVQNRNSKRAANL